MNDKYTRNGAGALTILKYYYYNIPYFFNLVIAICALLAALLTFSGLGKYNELIALRSSGISRIRAIIPVLISSIFVSIFMLFFNENVSVPAANAKDSVYNYEIFKRKPKAKIKRNLIQQLSNNAILQAESYDPSLKTMKKVNIQYFSDSLRVLRRFDANILRWKNNRWTLYQIQARKRDSAEEINFNFEILDSLSLAELSFTPADLEEKKFRAGRIERYLTIAELKDYSAKLRSFAQPTFIVDYEIYNAYFFPFSIFFMTFIGALLGSINNRGGNMIYFFICIFICLIYIAIITLGKIYGQSNTISPLMGALLPHLVTSVALFGLSFRR
jgi:lipopolysaccharide export system permease protein